MSSENSIKKSIILGVPQHFSLNLVFIKQLESLGFEVHDISIKEEKFRYKNIGLRLYNLYRKVFLKDYEYKGKLKMRSLEEKYEKKMRQVKRADYALFIRPDLFPVKIIKKVKELTTTCVAYQWDGLQRYPAIFSRLNLFDRFFVFDPSDLKINGTLPLTNFYLDQNQDTELTNDFDLLFIGTYIEERMEDIYRFFNLFKEKNKHKIHAMIHVHDADTADKIKEKCTILSSFENGIDYFENLKLAQSAKVLIDFSNYHHDGLSFRVLEAIGLNKKLITTQKSIKKYDFFDNANILIIDNFTSLNDVLTFLEIPFKPIASTIKNKYGFSNWIKYVLNIEGNTAITLPL